MIRRASLELLVRGLFGDDGAQPPKKPRTEPDATKAKRDAWPFVPSTPDHEFVLC